MQVRPALASLRPLPLVLVVAAVVAACGSGGAATPSSRASASPSRSGAVSSDGVASEEPTASAVAVVDPTVGPAASPMARLSGTGTKDTARFKLVAGSYRVVWTITATGDRGCAQISVLRTPDGSTAEQVATKSLAAAGVEKGEDHVTIPATGTHYVSIVSTCRWALTILPE